LSATHSQIPIGGDGIAIYGPLGTSMAFCINGDLEAVTQDDDTITLKDAAKHFGFSVYTLRTEADRGRLAI
jgi:hypothetical protein